MTGTAETPDPGRRVAAIVMWLGIATAAAAPVSAQSLKHPNVANPATISGSRAETVYQAIRRQMREHYSRTGDPLFVAYQRWRRFNRHPYRAPNHGERFVNHYGNSAARNYLRVRRTGPLPVGSILIKDSFTFTDTGAVLTGPLFMMEKMSREFRSLAGDWRFLMLRPDGSLVGITGGEGARNVRFCAECHNKAGAENDYLFRLPKGVSPRN